MTKEDERIRIVQDKLGQCLASGSTAQHFTYGNIPQNRFDGARRKYASNAEYDDVLGLIDTTIFGGGERGMLITQYGIYYKGILESPVFYEYSDLVDFSLPDDVYFSSAGLKDMLQDLYNLENNYTNSSNGGFLNNLLDVADSFIGTALEEYQKNKAEEEYQLEQDVLNILDDYKAYLKDTIKTLNEFTLDYYEFEEIDEVLEIIYRIFAIACIFSNDISWYEEIADTEDNNYIEGFNNTKELIDDIDDALSTIYAEYTNNISLNFAYRQFASRISNVYDDIAELCEDDDIDLEELYNKCQKAIKELKKKLKNLISLINEAIESFYDDEDEDIYLE